MQWKRWLVWSLLALAVLAIVPRHTQAAPRLAGNLITNPGFEGAFVAQDDKTSVGQGWTAWWIPWFEGQPEWSYHHPDFIASAPCGSVCDHRIHSGGNAQRIFQYFGTYMAGVYQRVNVTSGSDVRLTAFGQSWSSTTEQPQNVSNGGTSMHLRVGIDPWGGTNPYDARIVWSSEADALDSWQQFSVYARAQSAQVTVFLYAAPDDARRKNEVYWDDAVLEVLNGDLAATAQATYPTATPVPVAVVPTAVSVALGQNMLVDGSFEGPLYIPCTRADALPWNHISCEGLDLRKVDGKREYIRWDTVQVPIGWKAWWLSPNKNTGAPDFYQNHPNRCSGDAPEGCVAWHNPEFRDAKGIVLGPSRIHSGKNAQKYFTLWSVHQAGVMQTVAVPPGAMLRFGAWMHAWSTNQDGREEFPDSYFSSGQSSMHMKVGIDPCGGENPFSPSVVWGAEHDAYDQFGYYEVRATAQCDKVTVFTHTMPEKGLKHNDVYLDDAELVIIDASGVVQPAPAAPAAPPAAPVNPVSPSSVVNAAPAPTALPRPDGAVVHVVKAGDTIFGLAFQYDVAMDQILQLNGLTKDSFIHVGQELVISAPPPSASTPAPVDTASVPTATSLPATAVALVEPSGRTELCVRAFGDQNADGVMNRSEELLKDTFFQVSDRSGKPVVSYTSDGMSEPHCFTRLTPGEYLVSVKPAAGMKPTSDQRWTVVLNTGTAATVNFGSRFSEDLAEAGDSAESGGAIGLVLAAVVLGGIGVIIYRQRRGRATIS
ncbi:Muramidase-2 [Thermoflexales bacterium]|nr:Muramidase-2 [Thermoflexales bacterium]